MNSGISRCVSAITSRHWTTALTLAGICAALSLMTPVASAQTGHSAQVSWAAPSDATASSTYNIYRAPNACPASGLGTLTFTRINTTPVTTLSYTDSTITVGSWCYYVTQVQNGTESANSNTGGGTALPNAPAITVTVK